MPVRPALRIPWQPAAIPGTAAPYAPELLNSLVLWCLTLPHHLQGDRWTSLVGELVGTLTRSGGNIRAVFAPSTRQGNLQCVACDGVNAYVNFGDQDIFDQILTGSYTVAFWVRTVQAAGVAHRILGKGNNLLTVRTASGTPGTWRFFTNEVVTGFATTRTTLNDGLWHHLVFTREGTTATTAIRTIYVDGVLDTGPTAEDGSGSIAANSNNFQVGWDGTNNGSGTQQYGGDVDDVQLHSRVLTRAEVAHIYRMSLYGYPDIVRPRRPVLPFVPENVTVVSHSTISARAQIPSYTIFQSLLFPPVSARAQVPAPQFSIAFHASAISARAQVPAPLTTRILPTFSAIRARARTGIPIITAPPPPRPVNSYFMTTSGDLRRFIRGDWLVQAPNIGLKLSFDYDGTADDTGWEHRILDIQPIEITAPPGGGMATVGNATITVAETRTGKSILNLWQQYATLNGVPITIDLFLPDAPLSNLGISNPMRVFTGKIDTITLHNARTDILCVDDSIQQNMLLPQTLVTSAAFPNAISAAYGQPEPLIYGAGSNIGAAPLLFVDIPTNTYLVAGHPMYLGSGNIAVWDQANTLFLAASGVLTFANDASALVTIGVFNQGTLSWGSAVGVTNGANAVDGNSATLAIVNTGTLDSNGADGYGTLGIFQAPPGTPNTETMQVTLMNHRRSPGSDPTVTGTFYVQIISPTTGSLLRTLHTTEAFRQTTSAQTDVITLSNMRIATNEMLEVKLIARNEGTLGTASQTYEIGEVQVAGIVAYSATSAGLTTMTLPMNTQEIRFNVISYTLALDSANTDSFVISPNNAIDLNSNTYAIIPTCALDSNLDGVGQLTVITPVNSAQFGNNTLSIDFTKHRRNLSSTPTVTGTFFVQTVNPTTTVILRDNLFVSPPYRQQLNPLSTSFTATAINLGANVQVAVRVLARNEGGFGSYNAGMSSVVSVMSTVTFLTKWGTQGTGAGQFQYPTYLARTSNGNLWVTDQLNSRLQQFTPTGTFVQMFGASGVAGGQFVLPLGIAVDASNDVWVTDAGRIQAFDSTGNFLFQFYPPDGLTPASPWGVAVDAVTNVWVTDIVNNAIQKFDSAGAFLTSFGQSGTGQREFQNPTAIMIDASDTVWICDTGNQRVQALTSGGVFVRQFGSIGTGNGLFNWPIGIAAGISGTVWVVDNVNNTVQRFTSGGTYLLTGGSGGAGNGQFNAPVGIVTDTSNTFYVADQNNQRIQQFSVSFTSTTSVVTSGANDAYDIAEIGIKSFHQPAGGNMPVFLYGASWYGRYDATGAIVSYAGLAPNTFFHTPDEVIASLLVQEMGRIPTASAFAAAYTWYTAISFTLDGGIGAGWAVTRDQARKILHDAAQQATAILAPNFDNTFRLSPYRTDAPIVLSFSTSNILAVDGDVTQPSDQLNDTMQITLGNLQMVHNAFELQYAYNAGSKTYGKTMRVDHNGSTLGEDAPYKSLVESLCEQSYLRHGELAPLSLPCYWLADDDSAQYLLGFLVQYFSGQRTFVEFDTTLYAASVRVGDFITVSHPLLPDGDNGGDFEVHTIRYLPLQGRIHLIASKVANLTTPAKPSIAARARVPAPIVRQSVSGVAINWAEAWTYPDYTSTVIFTETFPTS